MPAPPPANVPPTDYTADSLLYAFMTRVEGLRTLPYDDTKGYISIGIGRNLSGRGLSSDEVVYLYRNDVRDCCTLMDQHIAWWRKLNADCQRAMISLCFMGWGTFSEFRLFLEAMQSLATMPPGNDEFAVLQIRKAHTELQQSAWWNEVGQRGPLTLNLIHR